MPGCGHDPTSNFHERASGADLVASSDRWVTTSRRPHMAIAGTELREAPHFQPPRARVIQRESPRSSGGS